MNSGCNILIERMRAKFKSQLSGDYQFKKLFEKIKTIKEIDRIEAVMSIEYKEYDGINQYCSRIVGKFDIECLEFYHLHLKKYEIILEYIYDGECIPTRPSLLVKGGDLIVEKRIL